MKVPKDLEEFFTDFFAKSGAKGGKIRAKNLTAAKRSQIAKKASRARWAKKGRKRK